MTVNLAQWSKCHGPNSHLKNAHGFNGTQAVKSTVLKLWPEKEDEDEEKQELYQFENGQSSDEEGAGDVMEESTSEDEVTDKV